MNGRVLYKEDISLINAMIQFGGQRWKACDHLGWNWEYFVVAHKKLRWALYQGRRFAPIEIRKYRPGQKIYSATI